MNKNVLRNFAINARLELLARVQDRAAFYGITDEKVKNNQIVSSNTFQKIDGQLLSRNEVVQRNALLQRIQNNGYVQVMEEAAYTWFNRFIAIKYMEAHGLLPIDQRVIPQRAGELPQLVREAQNTTLESINFDVIVQHLDANRTEELYKYLVISLCNQFSGCLPQMFEKISDYTELLFPDGLMKAESFLGMLANIEDENWQEIQAIGWLYQYYNTDLKNETFDLLKRNVKITKDRIGAATQLFTPEWIVRYMVENSLGRLWYEGHPDDNLKAKWRYYLDEVKQEVEVETQLAEIRKEREKLQLEEIKLIDPCMGSGHILVYAFDILMEIYRSVGYTDRDAVQSIIQNNIYGLDIDDRAAQLAYFALMMKAAEYDKRFLKRNIQPNICAIQESNSLVEFNRLKSQMSLDTTCLNTADQLIAAFIDAKEYGSILATDAINFSSVNMLLEQIELDETTDLELAAWIGRAKAIIPQLAMQTMILQQSYDVVITNPPYMGNANMNEKLSTYVRSNYPDSRGDMFAVFIERGLSLAKTHGFESMITQQSWMFLSSYSKLREKLEKKRTINMLHLGLNAFDSSLVQSTAFVFANDTYDKYKSVYVRLTDEKTAEEKEAALHREDCRFITTNDSFKNIVGKPIAYWLSDKMLKAFSDGHKLGSFAYAGQGMATTNNARFLRYWYEVNVNSIGFNAKDESDTEGSQKWFLYNKGGEFRKWYGNNDLVVNFQNHGKELGDYISQTTSISRRIANREYFFKECFSWSLIGNIAAFRFKPKGFIFDVAGMSCFSENHLKYLLGLCNSTVAMKLLLVLAPTVNFQCGDIANIPVFIDEHVEKSVELIVDQNIEISKSDWDSFEFSWDFRTHPLVQALINMREKPAQTFIDLLVGGSLSKPTFRLDTCYRIWESQCLERFNILKKNEEELNRIFIDIYNLGEELTPEVADKDVTVRKADLGRDIRSLVSYAVGCMLGRYSLNVPGLAYAGGDWDSSKYAIYPADHDGILPITDDEYFQDDIVSMFVRWVKTVYGEETLEENLQFIANALNPNGGTSREVIRSYFLNDFYSDHLKLYQKRPIYWQFDSGKQNGFKALIYLHRYDQDTVARLRTDYVHELQDRYRTQLEDARKTAESGDARQRSAANKRAQKLDKQLTELNKYEELVHHYADMRISLDLDDGVKVNYAKLQDILTKIK